MTGTSWWVAAWTAIRPIPGMEKMFSTRAVDAKVPAKKRKICDVNVAKLRRMRLLRTR